MLASELSATFLHRKIGFGGKNYRPDAAIRGHIFCTFLSLVLRKELLDRLAARGATMPEWQCVVDDLLDLSTVEVEQDGRRALLRTAPHRSAPEH